MREQPFSGRAGGRGSKRDSVMLERESLCV